MSNELSIRHTNIFTRNIDAMCSYRYCFNQGGTRSSKTYSILQLLIYTCLTSKKKVSIIRKSLPALRATSMLDFFNILKELNLYDIRRHNKTEFSYTFPNNSVVEFFSLDDEMKVRGRKRDICYINEANELDFDEYLQLDLRTKEHMIVDFNPSDNESWLYEELDKPNAILIQSTYKDNVFLTESEVKTIEDLINRDDSYYRIYALGERPVAKSRIYSHFRSYKDLPQIVDYCYGVDFGFNHFSTLVKVMWAENGDVYIDELVYAQNLTVSELISNIKKYIDTDHKVYCDSARPEIIKELRMNNINAHSSNKEVKKGIDSVKSSMIYVSEHSLNVWKEFRLYRWKTDGERILDEVVKLNDDAMDAIRYAIHSHQKKKYNPSRTGIYTFKY